MPLEYDTDEKPKESTSLLGAMGKEALASTARTIAAPVIEQGAELVGEEPGGYLQRQAQTYRHVANVLEDLIPEDRRKQLDASFLPRTGEENAWEHPFGSLAMKAASAAPVMAAIAVTKNPMVGATVGAVQGEAQRLSDVKGEVENATSDQLEAMYPSFRDNIAMGLPENEARRLLVADLASPGSRTISAIGGAAGAAPIGHIAGGVRATSGLRRIGVGAGEAALGMGAMGGANDVAKQQGEVNVGARPAIDVSEAVRQGLSSAVEGAVFGGAFGGGREALSATKRGLAKVITRKGSSSEPGPDVTDALTGGQETPAGAPPEVEQTVGATPPTSLDEQIAERQRQMDTQNAAPTPPTEPTPVTPPGTATATPPGTAAPLTAPIAPLPKKPRGRKAAAPTEAAPTEAAPLPPDDQIAQTHTYTEPLGPNLPPPDQVAQVHTYTEPVGPNPPAQPGAPIKTTEIKDTVGQVGKGLVGSLYDGLFKALQAGKDTFAGIRDPILTLAKAEYDAGRIQSPEQLQQTVNSPDFQARLKAENDARATAAKQKPVTAEGIKVAPKVEPAAATVTTSAPKTTSKRMAAAATRDYDTRRALEAAGYLQGDPLAWPYDLRKNGVSDSAVRTLESAGLATDGKMTKEQWQAWDKEMRQLRSEGKVAVGRDAQPAVSEGGIREEAKPARLSYGELLRQIEARDQALKTKHGSDYVGYRLEAKEDPELVRLRAAADAVPEAEKDVYRKKLYKALGGDVTEEAKKAAAQVTTKLPEGVKVARKVGDTVGKETARKIGTLVVKKATTVAEQVAAENAAAKAEREKARAEGKPVVLKSDKTVNVDKLAEEAANEHRENDAQRRAAGRERQRKATDNQAKDIIRSFPISEDDRTLAVKGDNESVATYVKRLQNMVKAALQDRIPIVNEAGNIRPERLDEGVIPHVSFLRDAERLVRRAQSLIGEKDAAVQASKMEAIREGVRDLIHQENMLREGKIEEANAMRRAKREAERMKRSLGKGEDVASAGEHTEGDREGEGEPHIPAATSRRGFLKGAGAFIGKKLLPNLPEGVTTKEEPKKTWPGKEEEDAWAEKLLNDTTEFDKPWHERGLAKDIAHKAATITETLAGHYKDMADIARRKAKDMLELADKHDRRAANWFKKRGPDSSAGHANADMADMFREEAHNYEADALDHEDRAAGREPPERERYKGFSATIEPQVETPDGPNTKGLVTIKASQDVWDHINRSVQTVGSILSNFKPDYADRNGARLQFRVAGVIRAIRARVEGVRVAVLPDELMDKFRPNIFQFGTADGYYIPSKGYKGPGLIVVRESANNAYVNIHEAVHAATHLALEHDADLRNKAQQLLDYARNNWPDSVESREAYGLQDVHEFVAEAMSNPDFQARLQNMYIHDAFRPKFNVRTAWDAFVRLVARGVGIADGHRNVLDAAMRLFDEAAETSVALRKQPAGDVVAQEKALAAIRRPTGGEVRDYFEERLGSTNEWKLRRQRVLDKLSSLTQLGNTSDRLFGPDRPARRLVDLLAKMHTEKENLIDRDADLVRNLYSASRKYAENGLFERFANFLNDETSAGVFADRSLKDQGIYKKDGSVRLDAEFRRGQYNKLKTEWDQIKAIAPEFANLRGQLHEMGARIQREMAEQLINNQLEAIAPGGSTALAKRIFDNKLTEADKSVLGDALPRIREASGLTALKGPYVPLMRRGDFIVQGRHIIDAPAGTKRMDADEKANPNGHIIEFTDEAAARKFVGNPAMDLHAKVQRVYVDPTTGSRWGVDKDGTKVKLTAKDAGAEARYRVTVQDQHVEFFERERDAQARRAELSADPRMADVAHVDMRRRNAADFNLNFMPEQIRRMYKIMQQRDSFKAMPAAAQREMERQFIDASLASMATTRAQTRRLPRTNVRGASNDIARNTSQYISSTAGYTSKLRYQPQADAVMKQMQEITDQARYERGPAGAEGDMQTMRRQRLREFENRIYSGGTYEPTTLAGKLTTRVLQLSYLDKLASPAFHIINAMEPWTVSLPTLAGRHGLFKSAAAMQEAYRDIGAGAALASGFKDTAAAARRDTGLTDYTKDFKTRLAGRAHAKELGELFDKLHDTGLMARNAGLELSRVVNPDATMVGRGIDRADLMARQLGTAIESINRAVTGMAAYRLERSRGTEHAEALTRAVEAVHDTMGNYSGWNAAPIFNHPVGRIALQFKKYAQKTYYLLGKQAVAALHGDKEAMASFAGLMATHMLTAGILGLPLEALHAGMIGANILGLVQTKYDDLEQNVRRGAASVFGKWGGEAFTRGLPRALGVDLSSRVNLNQLALSPFDPKSGKKQDLYAYLAPMLLGAPADFVLDAAEGMQALTRGDVMEATRLIVPLKIYSDSVKAYQRATTGIESASGRKKMEPTSVLEAFIQASGFTPGSVAEHQEQASAIYSDQQVLGKQRNQFIADWVKAQPADRQSQWQSILQWNKGQPSNAQIRYQDLLSAMQRRIKEQSSGTYVNGIRYTSRDRHLAQQNAFYNT